MKALLLLSFIGVAFGGISNDCMKCICKLEGCKSQVGKCRNDGGSPSCGPYQIKEPYWIDGGRRGSGYEACTKQFECSQQTIRAYMDRYGPYCDGGGTCEDYMRMHNGGPNACKASSSQHDATDGYWRKAQQRCGF